MEFCKQNKYQKIDFIPVPGNENYLWMKPQSIIQYDAKKRGTKFLYYSKKCKGYGEIIGATPVCLKDRFPLADGFYRTDLSFGSVNGKHPLICIGVETHDKIKKSGLKGVYFDKILDKYDWQK